jgi:hypothetical protein
MLESYPVTIAMAFDSRPILMLDASGVNSLADDPHSEAMIAGLKSGYFVRFPFTIVSEIIASSSGERRKQLLRVCRRLLASAGDCIEPYDEIFKIMVLRFEQSLPLGLQYVNLRMQEAEKEIFRQENFDDETAAQEREHNRSQEKVFIGIYAQARIHFDKLAAGGTRMPASVSELISQLQASGAFWEMAKDIYGRVATRPADDSIIRRFYDECEPFRVLMIAIFAAQYDRCIRPLGEGPSLKSGRNDTFMAASLPYCEQFVTNDDGQLTCYREVLAVAGLNVTVRSYDEFIAGFCVPPRASAVGI